MEFQVDPDPQLEHELEAIAQQVMPNGSKSSQQTENQDTSEVSTRISHQQTARRERLDSVPEIYNVERGEEYYEMTIPDTLQRLQMTEEVHGDHVHDWIAEGMPVEIMRRVRGMEEFRERQAERPPEVPTNIERQNNRSVQRSEKAASKTGQAGETGVPDPVRDVISSTGRSLDASIQRAMEDRMGESFSDVQIHTGSTAAAACEAINARAFTVGSHIAFNQGEYDPESPEGQHVLAHELAHVRQQTDGAVSMLPQDNLELEIDPDPTLEREAEETAQQVMQGGPVVVNRMGTEMHIQRADKEMTRREFFSVGYQDIDESDIPDVDWAAVGRAGFEQFIRGNVPGGSELGAMKDEFDDQLSGSSQLIAKLDNESPPPSWTNEIAREVVERLDLGGDSTGLGVDSTGVRGGN